MTAAPGAVVDAPSATSSTPGPPRRGHRARAVWGWVVVALVATALAVVGALASGDRGQPTPLDPTSTTATGTKALVQVLRQRGTPVDVVRSAAEVRGGTVFVDDSDGSLTPSAARRIARSTRHLVVVTQDAEVLRAVGLRAAPSDVVQRRGAVSTSRCGIPEASRAGSVSVAGTSYTVRDDAATVCAPSGTGPDRAWGLVRVATARGDVTLVGTTAALQNGTITEAGNASFALGLLGRSDRVTWFVSSPGADGSAPTLAALAPPWIPSVLLTLGAVAVAAACWRGRRLGPLVVERMPVVVRAVETTEGRARLYARTRDRTHALDTLRIAATLRIGRRLGLPRSAHVDDVVRAAATAVGRPAADVGAVLVGGQVHDDRTLVRGAAALEALERDVDAAVAGADRTTTHHDPSGGRP